MVYLRCVKGNIFVDPKITLHCCNFSVEKVLEVPCKQARRPRSCCSGWVYPLPLAEDGLDDGAPTLTHVYSHIELDYCNNWVDLDILCLE
ncbi:hypothetical protein CFC21_090619 [Triticum aestivum]|uniref:Uncharacterized protein n=2 Tax=Triticum aestivum TaxID=4565 RepID=A0A3B6PTM3_WHEAT|nr:hypothetical protein CFC21_090619 [Triticum aestivum]